MGRVVFTESALLDLDSIEAYIAQDSPENASRFIVQLDETCHLLGEMPMMGRARDDLRAGVRMFVHRRYVILYSLLENGVVIERIASPYRNIKDMF